MSGGAARRRVHRALAAARGDPPTRATRRRARLRAGAGRRRRRRSLPRAARPVYDATALVGGGACSRPSARGSARSTCRTFWNALLLARSLATLQTLGRGRLVGLFGVGAKRATRRARPARARRRASASRGSTSCSTPCAPLLAGEVGDAQRPLHVARARERHAAAAAGADRGLGRGAARARAWCAATPTSGTRTSRRCASASRRCASALGRALPTWCWVFARPGATSRGRARDYRRARALVPRRSPTDEVARAILCGEPARCREQLARMRERARARAADRRSRRSRRGRARRARSRRSPRRRRREFPRLRGDVRAKPRYSGRRHARHDADGAAHHDRQRVIWLLQMVGEPNGVDLTELCAVSCRACFSARLHLAAVHLHVAALDRTRCTCC